MDMEKLLLIMLISVSLHLGYGYALDLKTTWSEFKTIFNKSYGAEEEAFRQQIWKDNTIAIETHNKLADEGQYKFWLKMNYFGDLTDREVYHILNGLGVHVNVSMTSSNPQRNIDLPTRVDWRLKRCVTEVKFQGKCGACYAFATTGALEGQHALKYGSLVSLSEQNIIDCTQIYGNKGCHGGSMDKAFLYVIANGGIDTEESYPYVAKTQSCQFKSHMVGSACSSFEDIPKGDEEALQEAVAKKGPVAVGVDARGYKFKFYSHGVYDNPACSSRELTHAMLVVGYGTRYGEDYWLVKNSWGRLWGKDGYVEMSRNKNNQCGIASMASYPIL